VCACVCVRVCVNLVAELQQQCEGIRQFVLQQRQTCLLSLLRPCPVLLFLVPLGNKKEENMNANELLNRVLGVNAQMSDQFLKRPSNPD